MIDDIDSTLYEKFETVFNAVRDEDATEGGEEEFTFDTLQEEYEYESKWPFDNMNDNNWDNKNYSKVTISGSENQSSTVQIDSTSEEDEAFKNLEKAIKNWKTLKP